MRTLLTNLTRFMPLMFLIVVLISLFQFFSQHPITWHGITHALRTLGSALAAGWFYIAVCAVLLWVLVIVGIDRLTNRRVLEDRMREEAEPIFLDADALARELKGKVIGRTRSVTTLLLKFVDASLCVNVESLSVYFFWRARRVLARLT